MEVYRRLISPYALCFIVAAGINDRLASFLNYPDRIAYLIDEGSPYSNQLFAAHTAVIDTERNLGKLPHTGPIAFDTDDHNAVLQAADVIAWSSRRKSEYGSLDNEFSPLAEILAMKVKPEMEIHIDFEVPRDGIGKFAETINAWLELNSEFPEMGLAAMLKSAPAPL